MTPVERLQAAIDKLEQVREHTVPGPWRVEPHDDTYAAIRAGVSYVTSGANFREEPDLYSREAELIVTLHRTIDAQLAILRDVLAGEKIERHWDTLVYTINTLALADAILGGEA